MQSIGVEELQSREGGVLPVVVIAGFVVSALGAIYLAGKISTSIWPTR